MRPMYLMYQKNRWWLGVLVVWSVWFSAVWMGGCDCDNAQVGQKPDLQVEPKAIVFAEIGVGNRQNQTLQMINRGNAALEVTGLQLDPGGDKSYRLVNPPDIPFRLAPAESIGLVVQFQPTTAGRPESALWIDSNDSKQARTIVPIRTVGNAPRIEVKPISLDFGFVDTGKMVTRTFDIKNVGSAELELQKLYIASPGKDFSLQDTAGTWPLRLAGQQSVTIKVGYQPSDAGADIGEVWIENTDPNKPKERVLLQGQRSEPNLVVNPTRLDFGGVPPQKSRSLPLILSNRGGAKLTITQMVKETGSDPVFSFVTPPTPIVIEPGDSITVATFYAPKDKGMNQGTIVISSDDPDSPVIKVPMLGQSPPSGLEVNPLLLDFGSLPQKASRTLALYVINKGNSTIQIKALPIQSANPVFQLAAPPALPYDLTPNSFLVLKVTYAPQSGNGDQGTLDIQSSDLTSPSILVKLVGAVIPAPPCFLQGNPSLLNFQQVALGQSSQQKVEITNLGSGTCWLFEVGMAPATDLDFSVTSGTIVLPVSLGSGSKYSVTVAYSPQRAGSASGTLQVVHGQGLLNRLPPLQVVLSAIGAGPLLCLHPNSVDFGSVTKGTKKNESFRVVSCGTQPVQISQIVLDTGTTAEYTLTSVPSLPVTLQVNQDIQVTATYAPTDVGFDLGKVKIVSNAAGTGPDYAYLRGYGIEPGETCGAMSGRICAPDGQTWLTGATVSVKLPNGKTLSTTTDIDGYFYLPCIPAGSHAFEIRKGSFTGNFQATITSNTTNVLQNPQCVDPSRTKIAVVWGEYDSIQNILDRLKLSYTFYQGNTYQLLSSLNEMKKYNIIFFNCGMDESLLNSTVANNLRQYVKGGGSVYASDFSYDLIEVAWPQAVDWLGDDNQRDAAQQLSPAQVQANVLSPTLVNRLGGRSQITLNFSFCPCAGADSAGSGTQVVLSGDRSKQGNNNEPLAIYFKPDPGGGNVIYTTFHNDEQYSRTIDIILRFLIFEL